MNDARTPTGTPRIDVSDLAKHIESGDAFLLDLRRSTGSKQIYGAIRYDRKKLLDAEKLVLPLPKTDGTIVLYDEHGDSDVLEQLATKLASDGYAGIHILAGGFKAWEEADGKTEEPTLEQPVPLVTKHQIER